MEKNYVEFFIPGAFFSESEIIEIESWDVDIALEMMKKNSKRMNLIPYGFRFFTKGRNDNELDSKIIKTSHMYYLGGVLKTLKEVKEENNPENRILITNMENNDYKRVIFNYNSWKITLPLYDDDIILHFDKEDFLNGKK